MANASIDYFILLIIFCLKIKQKKNILHLQSVKHLLLNKWWNQILYQSQLRNTKKVQGFYNYTVYACICLCFYVVAFICKRRMILCAYLVYQVRILVHKKVSKSLQTDSVEKDEKSKLIWLYRNSNVCIGIYIDVKDTHTRIYSYWITLID